MGRTKLTRGWRWKDSEPNKTSPKRLINVDTLELRAFPEDIPPYAVLSHRWGEDELSFESYSDAAKRQTQGFEKISSFCQFVRESRDNDLCDGVRVEWVWVDTCCIDKRSSAELSEAVNSMALWYQHAVFCVAYLSDVEGSTKRTIWEPTFRQSEYWTRGWTLQEVLFPRAVAFCNSDWKMILQLDFESDDALSLVSEITHIPRKCFEDLERIFAESVACRMSWASNRRTTRKEDEAYCLLGLFRLTMPLVYGEGDHAFIRLQEEIIKQCDDESVFAWTEPDDAEDKNLYPLLARSPSQFRHGSNIICAEFEERKPYHITNKGLQFEAPAVEVWDTLRGRKRMLLIQLNCCSARPHYDEVELETSMFPEEPCMIALMKGIRRGYGSSYARVHPFNLGHDLWQYAISQQDTYCISLLPKDTYFIALEKTRISHAGKWIETPKRLLENLPTLESRYLAMESRAELDDSSRMSVLHKVPATVGSQPGLQSSVRRHGSVKKSQELFRPTIRVGHDESPNDTLVK